LICREPPEDSNVPVLIRLQDVDLLQGLEDLAGNGAGRLDVVGRAGTAVLGTTVKLLQSTNTDAAAEVDVASNGGYSLPYMKEMFGD